MPDAVPGDALLAAALGSLAAACLTALAAGGVGTGRRHALARALGIAGSLLAALRAAAVLIGSPAAELAWWPGFPGQPFILGVDLLAAPFVLLLGVVGAASFAAMDPRAVGGRVLALHAGFVTALLAVFAARHVLMLLLAWEGMALLSAALVASEPGRARTRRAVWVYLALSQVGTAALTGALLTLATHGGGWDLAAVSRGYAALPAADAAWMAWCITLGAAVKLGLVPLHAWLPLAHPEAPAPVSAVLSGVMVKAGLYLMLRLVWALPGQPPAGWGTALLLAGMATALTGALRAALDTDAKRVLAWSTIKHAGVLAMATGLAALLAGAGQAATARLALAAALVHGVGHGLAKATAFIAVGQAVHGAGTRDLERLGGLAARAPRAFLGTTGAALALAGLPALSCFAGEWLLLQALLHGYSAGAGQLRLLAPFAVAALALASALAVAALVRLVGLGFLGRARSEAVAAAHDGDAAASAGLLGVLGLTVAAGIAAPQLRALLAPAIAPLAAAGPGMESAPTALVLEHAGASASPFAVVVLVALFSVLGFALARAGHRGSVRRAPSWSCGAPLTPRMQTSARGFAMPLRLVFEPLLRGRDAGAVWSGSADAAGGAAPARPVAALAAVVEWVVPRIRRIQAAPLHVHLALLLLTLLLLLVAGRR